MKRLHLLVVIFAMAIGPVTTHATLIDVTWSGTVTDSIISNVSVGDGAFGSFTYDTALPVDGRGANVTIYDGDITSSFTIGDLSGSLADQNLAIFDNSIEYDVFDQFDIRSTLDLDPSNYSGDAFDGTTPIQLFWGLRGADSVLSDLSVPGDELDLLSWTSAIARLDTVPDGEGAFDIVGAVYLSIDKFTATARVETVPEPCTLALFAIALAAIGWMGRRGRVRAVVGTDGKPQI